MGEAWTELQIGSANSELSGTSAQAIVSSVAFPCMLLYVNKWAGRVAVCEYLRKEEKSTYQDYVTTSDLGTTGGAI